MTAFPCLRWLKLAAAAIASTAAVSCVPMETPACYSSYDPAVKTGPALRHYPVGRQGNLTAWLTSDHRMAASDWLYSPGKGAIRHRIVGKIHASAMPSRPMHDGAFLLTADYHGPIYPLWEGTEGTGYLYAGFENGWLPVKLYQGNVINTWVQLPGKMQVGGWSGFPVVIGKPAHPEAIAGAMWYRSNSEPSAGGATSTRLLKHWLGRIRFADYVEPQFREAVLTGKVP